MFLRVRVLLSCACSRECGAHVRAPCVFSRPQVRVDVVAAPANSSLIFFGHRGVRIRSLSTKEADAGVWPWRAAASSGEAASALAESKDHIGSDGDEEEDDAPAIGWETVKAKGGLRVARECEFTARRKISSR